MHSLTKYPFPRETEAQQARLINKPTSIFKLLGRFQMLPLFKVSQETAAVNPENVTFGPGHYSIRLLSKEDFFFKIASYCILHFIFEKAYDARNTHVYNKVLQFIFNNEIELPSALKGLTQEEAKVCLVKFLHILQRAKSKRRIVVEELKKLPQISVLFVALVKTAGKHHQLVVQRNARELQKNLADAFGIDFTLLNYDLFIFAGEFQVKINRFDSFYEFSVTRQKPETIQRIKEQCEDFLGRVFAINGFQASFQAPNVDSKLKRKDTVRSIEWVQSEDADSESEQDNSFQAASPVKTKDMNDSQHTGGTFVKGKTTTELSYTQDRTIPDFTEAPSLRFKAQILNFWEIVRQESQSLSWVPNQASSMTNHRHDLPSTLTSASLRTGGKFHKPSFCCTDFSLSAAGRARPATREQSASKSVQEKKRPRDQSQSSKITKKDRRVPTFILNRAKKNSQKSNATPQKMQTGLIIPVSVSPVRSKTPKITFTYTAK